MSYSGKGSTEESDPTDQFEESLSGKEPNSLSGKNSLQADSFELAFPSTIYDDYIKNNTLSISPRDKLSFIDDKKQWKNTTRYLAGNADLNKFTRMIQTEVIRCKPDNILDFINDEFFSLENQPRLRGIFRD